MRINPEKLVFAREQLHQSVQIPSLITRHFIEAREDDSHANLSWDSDSEGFWSRELNKDTGLQVGILVDEFSLAFRSNKLPLKKINLDQITINEALRWTISRIASYGIFIDKISMTSPFQLSNMRVLKGEHFSIDDFQNLNELSAYYQQASRTLSNTCKNLKNASEIRCWPHHFDIASLVTLSIGKEEADVKSIGLGFSPGDEQMSIPYYYVSIWPYSENLAKHQSDLKSQGVWNKSSWFGLVLPASTFITIESPEAQDQVINEFLSEGLQIGQDLLSK